MQIQKLYIAPTSITPEINFSPEENIFLMSGTSSPEDVRAMYYPVIEWMIQFVDNIILEGKHSFTSDDPLRFHCNLEYFNSSSAKFLYDIFNELKRLDSAQVPVIVEWLYDEEDIDHKEAGADIATLVEMEFTYISKNK